MLEPGDSINLQYSTTAAELGITQDGVYPVLVNVDGTRNGLVERVGELSTYLVSFSSSAAGASPWPGCGP